MISQIGPLVQAGSALRNAPQLHVMGAIIGSFASGSFLGFVGAVVFALFPEARAAATVSVGLMISLSSLADLELVGVAPIGTTRQTPGNWTCVLGPRGASFGWGVDLGNGLTTRLPYYALVGLLLAAVLAEHPWQSIMILMAYGVARSVAVLSVMWTRPNHTAEVCTLLDRRSHLLRHSVGFAGLLVGTTIIVSAIA